MNTCHANSMTGTAFYPDTGTQHTGTHRNTQGHTLSNPVAAARSGYRSKLQVYRSIERYLKAFRGRHLIGRHLKRKALAHTAPRIPVPKLPYCFFSRPSVTVIPIAATTTQVIATIPCTPSRSPSNKAPIKAATTGSTLTITP